MKTNRRSFLALLGLAPIAAKSIDLQPKAVVLPKALSSDHAKTLILQPGSKVYDAQYWESEFSRKLSITLEIYGKSKLNIGELFWPLGSLFTGEDMCRIFSFSSDSFWFRNDQRWVLTKKERHATQVSDRVTVEFAAFRTDITGFL